MQKERDKSEEIFEFRACKAFEPGDVSAWEKREAREGEKREVSRGEGEKGEGEEGEGGGKRGKRRARERRGNVLICEGRTVGSTSHQELRWRVCVYGEKEVEEGCLAREGREGGR